KAPGNGMTGTYPGKITDSSMCFAILKYTRPRNGRSSAHFQNSHDWASTNSEGTKLFERHLTFDVGLAKRRIDKPRAAMCEKNARDRAKFSDSHDTDSKVDVFLCHEVKQSREFGQRVRAGGNLENVCAPCLRRPLADAAR